MMQGPRQPGVTQNSPAPINPATSNLTPSGESNQSRMQPGQTRPGTSAGTVIVQPFQPGPPKEISRNYRVPSHRDDTRVTRTDDGRIIFEQAINLSRQLHDKDIPPEEDIQILDAILGYYRMMNKSNPVAGENFEVVRSLMGKNKQSVVVFPSNHPDIDNEGNLLDRWGTPYFFHAISSTTLDIQSAGPDRQRGSADDLKLGHELPESG
ncbi:MAG: hypothetical protein GY899_12725 [Verrucomicrobiaceae bacterium]|nr:hypothetical protein [Verrucomicrobiaceae bacterium]